ncbi:hypothetical protein XELAEV_18012615mg [Xenopus laevis]|uniref:Uncharacterized protein n=1 Tax=Xenopus laevis TaxID=8355 RepID=A0A974DPU8_XENLA|nr:hypothetical protein XELAEV_18012615mg [Xenopus laevis]
MDVGNVTILVHAGPYTRTLHTRLYILNAAFRIRIKRINVAFMREEIFLISGVRGSMPLWTSETLCWSYAF